MAIILIYFCLVNAAGYLSFAWDKHCARHNLRRIPEGSLLSLAAIGGTIGVVAAQRIHRHKTQKEPFRTYLQLIGGVQLVLLVGALFLWLEQSLS